ncbi:DUF389 domain-containing protein [Candidatus Uhrbacteria bacterium]|nr:DUF389 domain-containing protein [Candidatus Uhrbacteria bacterium]
MPITLLDHISSKEKDATIEKLFSHSSPSQDFFLMVSLSVIMATFGLLIDSPMIVIGSMLIAPILYPILSLSMGIVMSDRKVIGRTLLTLGTAIVYASITSVVLTILFGDGTRSNATAVYSQALPSLPHVIVAVVAGFAAAFALVKPQLSEMLPGIAISVSLIPPLAAVGIGIASIDFALARGALLLFIINLVGIVFAGMFVFSLMNFYAKKTVAREVLQEEEKELKKENEKQGK